jgi:hypothetical protein
MTGMSARLARRVDEGRGETRPGARRERGRDAGETRAGRCYPQVTPPRYRSGQLAIWR